MLQGQLLIRQIVIIGIGIQMCFGSEVVAESSAYETGIPYR